MVFEIGKYYKHSGGGYLHILGEIKTTMWFDCFVAEEAGHGNSELKPVGKDETSAQNWSETTEADWKTNFS